MVTCETVFSALGHDCRTIADNELAVTTPIDMPDGTPVCVHLRERGEEAILTDLGDTLLNALSTGLRHKPRFTDTFVRRVQETGATVEDGEIVVRCRMDGLQTGYARFLAAAIAATNYITERTMLEEQEDRLVQDIEEHIRRRNPDVEIDHNVRIRGASGQEHTFPLKARDTLIVPTRPTGQSTGAAIRRILDVEKALESPRPIVVMDDSGNHEGAGRESRIVASVARVMPLSHLAGDSTPLDLAG